MQRYLTTREISDALKCSPRTARSLVIREMPYIRVGRGQNELRVLETDFQSYVRKLESNNKWRNERGNGL